MSIQLILSLLLVVVVSGGIFGLRKEEISNCGGCFKDYIYNSSEGGWLVDFDFDYLWVGELGRNSWGCDCSDLRTKASIADYQKLSETFGCIGDCTSKCCICDCTLKSCDYTMPKKKQQVFLVDPSDGTSKTYVNYMIFNDLIFNKIYISYRSKTWCKKFCDFMKNGAKFTENFTIEAHPNFELKEYLKNITKFFLARDFAGFFRCFRKGMFVVF